MHRVSLFLLLAFFSLVSCGNYEDKAIYDIIPQPVNLIPGIGYFHFSEANTIYIGDTSLLHVSSVLYEDLKPYTHIAKSKEPSSDICLMLNPSWDNKERYSIKVDDSGIRIEGASTKAVFYAIQSVKQLLVSNSTETLGKIPFVEIDDEPRFKYRGMHLDVARHMFPVEFIKKYIDLMAFHKFNTFHWHLTEDQGWRIEIKKYPKLQSIAAYRQETMNGHYSDNPRTFDGKKYGGFYSHDDIREIVSYAAKKYVDVIPEIEMPGHSLAALSAYPELACTEGPFEAATTWGVFEDVYCPTEKTFEFLVNVLEEVATLFPSKYIHIGGDECPKTRWMESAFCQELIKEEGLKDEHELQSYFIGRIEKYLNSIGKQIIGWDEILEGGLAPNATVMSWRGIQGGVEAAKSKHQVIMSPTTHCYFDYYQSKSPNEPLAIGGFLPLEKVYEFEPIPEALSDEEAQYIIGAQCNLWTEYIKTPEQVEYMVYPRACALAEVNWSRKEDRDFEDFSLRLGSHLERLSKMNVNFADHYYDAELVSSYQLDGSYVLTLSTNTQNQDIYYNKDGQAPTLESHVYKEPLLISKKANIKAACYDTKAERFGRVQSFDYSPHLATGNKVVLHGKPSTRYAGYLGDTTLIDGRRGGKSFNAENWLGFEGDDLIANITFEVETEINSVTVGSLRAKSAWIYLPSEIKLNARNAQGEWVELAKINEDDISKQDPHNILIKVQDFSTKEIEVQVLNHGLIREGQPGSGHKSWLFVDEIIIR
jgi:hexosaminidase